MCMYEYVPYATAKEIYALKIYCWYCMYVHKLIMGISEAMTNSMRAKMTSSKMLVLFAAHE